MLSELPPKLQADNTEANVKKEAFLAFLAEISLLIVDFILSFRESFLIKVFDSFLHFFTLFNT